MADRACPPGFAALFGADPAIHADAPGRVNLLGEHTDYHGGFVLPTVIAERTRVQLRPRDDRRVRAWSDGVSDGIAEYELGDPAVLIASSTRIERELHWRAEHRDLESIVRSAWDWMQQHDERSLRRPAARSTTSR